MKKYLLAWMLMGGWTVASALPFNIQASPGQPLPTTFQTGQTLTAFYTVQNNTGIARNNNYVKHLPANATQVIEQGLCGATFTLGPHGSANDTCLLQLSITGTTNGIATPLMICFPEGLTCAGTPDTLNIVPAPAGSGSIVRAAIGGSGSGTGLLESSIDSLTTWQQQESSLPTIVSFAATECVGSGDNALCVAGGTTDPLGGGVPVGVSLNGGKTWSPSEELSSGSGINISGISCTNSWFCVAAGASPPSPYIAIRSNTSGLWNTSNFNFPGSLARFDSAACATNGSICLAGGTGGGTPYIFQSTTPNVPASWSAATLPGGLTGSFKTASCAADGGLCLAAGGANLIQTLNLGATWAVPATFTTPPVTATLAFAGSSCTGSGSTAWCVAVGADPGPPTAVGGQIWQTLNTGSSWALVAFTPALSTSSQFNAASCIGTPTNGLCVAVGADGTSNALLAVRKNAGAWTVIPPANIVGLGGATAVLNEVSCSGSGATASCVAVGQNLTNLQTLIIESKDSGTTWTVNTSGSVSGTLNTVSVTGG